MAVFVFILFFVLGLTFFSLGVYLIVSDEDCLGTISSVFGAIVLILGITVLGIDHTNKSKVDALLETGKYEIVTHNDYSLNELKQFKNVGGVYIKEIEQ